MVSGSAGGHVRPEGVGAARRDLAAEGGGPISLGAELGPPGPEPPRDEVQRVLVREADGAVALVRDTRAEARRLTGADLGDGDVERGIARVHGREAALGGHAGG